MKVKIPKATPKQVEYLQILANDLGYSYRQRKLQLMADYNVWYFDELTIEQATSLIDKWIEQKATK